MAAAGGDSCLKLVADANIWIDLDNGGVIALVFALPYEFASPDVVVAELGTELGAMVSDQGLMVSVRETGPDEAWLQLRVRYKRPGDADLYALLLAIEQRWVLVTGDGDLREAAEQEGLECHGVLWLLDKLVANGLLPMPAAARSLRQMLQQDARLPTDECGKRLLRWERA